MKVKIAPIDSYDDDHLFPQGEELEHENSRECWCSPKVIRKDNMMGYFYIISHRRTKKVMQEMAKKVNHEYT